MKDVSETKLNADIKQLNRQRNSNPMPISDELVWLRQEQKDFKEQKVRIEMEAFRQEVNEIIFPCLCVSRGRPQQQTQGVVEEEGGEIPDLGI